MINQRNKNAAAIRPPGAESSLAGFIVQNVFWRVLLFTLLLMFANGSPVLAGDERLAVSADVANIRSGPGTDHEVLWRVEKYHPFLIVDKTGNWYRFTDFEGDSAWIHESLLAKIDTVITQKTLCNIRSGPGTDFEIIGTTSSGIPFKVLERKNNWIHIQHADGDKGWIHASLVW
jgi:SH3-like domain-containing protein